MLIVLIACYHHNNFANALSYVFICGKEFYALNIAQNGFLELNEVPLNGPRASVPKTLTIYRRSTQRFQVTYFKF